MTDYLIRTVGIREALRDAAHDIDPELDVDDYRVLDEEEADSERRLLGGYTDVWILRPRKRGIAGDLTDASQRLVGVRVQPESGTTYQVLAQDGHPRSPRKFVGGQQAVDDAFTFAKRAVQDMRNTGGTAGIQEKRS